MNTQAYFDNIQQHIAKELRKANKSITVAVAWFTDTYLFTLLCDKAKSGVSVQLLLLDDDINNNSSIDYKRLTKVGGKVWKISAGGENERLMHNKFCVTDEETVINGSYNWTNKARQNHESITVIQDSELAYQFIEEFNALIRHYFGQTTERSIDYAKLYIRLEALKSVILLEDEEDIAYQISKLKKALSPPQAKDNDLAIVGQIIKETEQKHYGTAVTQITDFVSARRALNVFVDPETAVMHLEVKALGLQISSLEDEKAEIEKLLYLFNLRHDRELGSLIEKILNFRREKLNKEAKKDKSKQKSAKQAEQEYEEYKKSREANSLKKVASLNETEQKELKTAYRKATKLCHPDVVNESQKGQAEAVFQSLKEAYDSNDLQTIKAILTDLERGVFMPHSEKVTEKKELKTTISQLRHLRNELEAILVQLKNSETYRTVSDIGDWDNYFENIKIELEKEWKAINGEEELLD